MHISYRKNETDFWKIGQFLGCLRTTSKGQISIQHPVLLIPHQPTVIQPKIPKEDIFYRYDYRMSENIKAFDIPL